MSDKIKCALIFLISFFILVVVVTAVSNLMNLETVPINEFEKLIQGRIVHWFFQATFWETFPNFPSIHELQVLFNPLAMLITLPLLGFIIYLVRFRENISFAHTAIVCQVVAIVPWVFGMMVLNGNTAPDSAGPWLAVMLLGVFYTALTSGILALLELVKPKKIKRPQRQRNLSARDRYYARESLKNKTHRLARSTVRVHQNG